MDIDTQTIAWVAMAVGLVGIAWAIFWPVEPHPGVNPISTHWDLVYVDDDGVMQFTMVRVLKINPTSRRMTAWCAASGSERVFKLSKIVKATDVRSGARINIARLIDKPRVLTEQVPPIAPHAVPDTVPSDIDVGSWWSTSRLGLH
ncbi:MAG TPA: hypothetical protein VFW93_13920 [Aquabacterium sp.]|uniref:hypothetical protein n=1 Tax=Aquabacterium sp. TaxID=1872578 RepID=UPI002E31F345|nr:hypothetical protein [Aquabacterium sp.]HEX5357312.1 hypothetical protein [Aquabacterium sp.]